MFDIRSEVAAFRREADVDFIGLWHIASDVEDALGGDDKAVIRQYTLAIVQGLMKSGVYPGDYKMENFDKDGFQFWPGTPEQHIVRIEKNWMETGQVPTLQHPICWLALKHNY